jgi:3-oxoacyl-(acyl-carrier-protein) synthase
VTPYAITGVGLVSPLGTGFEQFRGGLAQWSAAPYDLFRAHPTVLDAKKVSQPIAAQCADFDAKKFLGDKGLRNFDRLTKFLIVSAKLALEDAGLKQGSVAPDRIGLCSATAYGSLEAVTEAVEVAELEDPRFLNPNRFPNTVINAAAGYVSIWEDLRAPNVTVVDGNCGALDAIFNGSAHLLNGRADAFLVGGGESLSEALYVAFRKLEVLADGPRNFDPGRPGSQGMLLGEGAAYLCIEPPQLAAARGARVRAEVIGYGNAFEPPASEALIVHVSSLAIARAIRSALADAELAPDDIDVVASAQSGIARFDAAEQQGIAAVFGDGSRAIAVPKRVFGETFGASGALAAACGLAWLDGVPVAPLLDSSAPQAVRHVLVLAVGYYGNASAIVLRRPA